ncbi:MAG: YggS family pyridoxal phosphate-dependent enzyme [Syntrophales bacterium]
MSSVGKNVEELRKRIAEAALRRNRNPSDVRLMAVTKTVDDERIMEAIDAGVDIIGENYVQEARRKIEKMGKRTQWHMIGYLQTNKAKYAVKLFDLIHSVHKLSLAEELDRRSKKEGCITRILIEVNMSGEASKSGVEKENVFGLIEQIAKFSNLSIQGLMTMAPWFRNPEDARPFFRDLRMLRDEIAQANISGVEMKELSMGMSDDYEVAVEEGSTIVRIGRRIFGERVKK